MTTLVLILYLASIVLFTMLGIALLYNTYQVFAWLWKIKYHNTNTDYEFKRIKYHRRQLLYIIPVMLVISFGIYAYNLPLDYDALIGYDADRITNIQVDSWGSGVPGKIYTLGDDERKTIIEYLDGYEYTRSLTASSLGTSSSMLRGTESLLISINGKDYKDYVHMIITNQGYLYISGINQAYKVEAEDEKLFYTGLIDTFRKDEISMLDKIKADLSKVPKQYDSKEAVADGCFVAVHGKLMSAENIIAEFTSGKRPDITIVQYTTEGDPIITRVAYDGGKYIGVEDNTRDNFAAQIDQKLWEFEYKYLKVFEDNGNRYYYLTDDKELTYEGIMKKLLSSKYEGPNNFKFLCSYMRE